jgi:hypothetical protein
MSISYTETETDTDREVSITATTVEGESIRSISIYQDGVRVARSVLSDSLTATIDKNGDYEVIVVDTRYESGQTNVYDLTEEPEPEPEVPLDSTVSVTNNTIDLTLSEMVRLIDLSKDNWIIKRKVFTDTFNYTPKEGGTYKLKIMELDMTTTYETVVIDEPSAPVYDNPTQIVDASFTQNSGGYDISVNVTPSDLARTRTIEVFKDGRRLDRAIFKDTLNITVNETGSYLIKVMNMNYKVVETTLSVQ